MTLYYPINFLKRPAVQNLVTAIFTQGMLSVASFMVGLSMVKFATKEEYGIYVMLSAIIGIVGNYQGALVNAPLTVMLSEKGPAEKVLFISGLGYGQWLFFFPLVILLLIVSIVYCLIINDFSIFKYVVSISIVSMMYLFREYVRTVNYSKLQIHLLMKTDTLFLLIVIAGFVLLILSNKVNSIYSINILGSGYFLAAIVGFYYESDIYCFNWEKIKSVFRETWHYSRWAVVGCTSAIVFNQGYIYIISILLGFRELAEISAARMFLGPISLFVASSSKIILAQGSDIFNKKGISRFRKFILSITIFLIFAWASYFLIVLLFYKQIIFFLGDKYGNIKNLVLLWSIYCFVNLLRFSISNALMIFKEFKTLASFDIFGAILTLTTCIILTHSTGSQGAILSSIIGEMTMLVFSVWRFFSFEHVQ